MARRGMYLKPLERALGVANLSRAAFTKIANEVLRDMKRDISMLDHPHARRFANSLYLVVKDRSFSIMSNDPHIDIADKGVRPHIMRYLEGKTIPFVDGDQIRFRTATADGFVRGKWKHPGLPGLNFVERSAKAARSQIIGSLVQLIKGKK